LVFRFDGGIADGFLRLRFECGKAQHQDPEGEQESAFHKPPLDLGPAL
jgi:hypothetical protein